MSKVEKKKLVTGKSFAKILGIVVGGFFGLFAITIGVMYLCGAFDRPIIPPKDIKFELSDNEYIEDVNGVSYYSPQIFQRDENGNLLKDDDGNCIIADEFYLTVQPTDVKGEKDERAVW